MSRETHQLVEAALLNSSGDPADEVRDALAAVCKFAMVECDESDEGLRAMLEEAIRRARVEADKL